MITVAELANAVCRGNGIRCVGEFEVGDEKMGRRDRETGSCCFIFPGFVLLVLLTALKRAARHFKFERGAFNQSRAPVCSLS